MIMAIGTDQELVVSATIIQMVVPILFDEIRAHKTTSQLNLTRFAFERRHIVIISFVIRARYHHVHVRLYIGRPLQSNDINTSDYSV